MKQLPPFSKKADRLILSLVFLGALCLALLPLFRQGKQAVICIAGQQVAVIDLQEDQQAFSIDEADGFLFSVNQGAIRIIEAPCPMQQCCDTPPASSEGQCIICLPQQLTITIRHTDDTAVAAPDAVIG